MNRLQTETRCRSDLPVWEQRFRAARVSLPDWAWYAPDRGVLLSNAGRHRSRSMPSMPQRPRDGHRAPVTPGHRPTAGHAARDHHPGRAGHLVVRRHRRRRVRCLAGAALGRQWQGPPGGAGAEARLARRPGDRAATAPPTSGVSDDDGSEIWRVPNDGGEPDLIYASRAGRQRRRRVRATGN